MPMMKTDRGGGLEIWTINRAFVVKRKLPSDKAFPQLS